MNSALHQALELAERGYRSFPCRESKAPACPHGFKEATDDSDELRRLWRRHPGPLIGVATGAASGITVVDVDPPGLLWLKERQCHIPDTRAHYTRRGGRHLLFLHRESIRNSASLIAPGVDMRGDGGYIIWWPADGHPVLHPGILAPLPDWLAARAARRREATPQRSASASSGNFRPRALHGLIRLMARAREGERNNTLFWVACRLGDHVAAGDITEGFALDLALEVAALVGLPADEARRTAESGIRGRA
jgi:hypothetical protein